MKERKDLLLLGAAVAALLVVGGSANAETMSEIDAFQRAVTTQNKQDSLAFIEGFGSSHLVPDLIELLRPEVAADLCANLPSRSPRARAACDRVAKAVASAGAIAPSSPKIAAPAFPTKGPDAPAVPAAPSTANAATQTASVKAAPAASQATALASSPQAGRVPIPPVAAAVKKTTAPTPSETAEVQSPAFVMLPKAAFAVVGEPPSEPDLLWSTARN